MEIFKKISRASALNRKQEQALYALALEEVQNKRIIYGLWAIALSKSGGDINRAESIYIPLRVQDMKDDSVLSEGFIDAIPDKESGRRVKIVEDEAKRLLNQFDAAGYTPLMRAAKASKAHEVKRLISEGADPNVKDNFSGKLTALDIAKDELRQRKKYGLMDAWAREPDTATVGYEEIVLMLGKVTGSTWRKGDGGN